MISIQPSCWSEHEELEAVMICAPPTVKMSKLRSVEDIHWIEPVDLDKAHEQFNTLKTTLESAGVQVINYCEHLSKEDQQLSEQLLHRVFTRDLASVCGDKILPGEAGAFMRAPEFAHSYQLLKSWFPDRLLNNPKHETGALETGDVFILNKDAVFINAGLRTSIETVMKVKNSLHKIGFSEIGVISLPHRMDTLHLDMCCNVANKDLIISKAFVRHYPVQVLTGNSQHYEMSGQFLNRHGFEVFWYDDYDTIPDINFISLDPETLLISSKTNKKRMKEHPILKKRKLIDIEVSELEKGGGGIRCMTMPLRRKS